MRFRKLIRTGRQLGGHKRVRRNDHRSLQEPVREEKRIKMAPMMYCRNNEEEIGQPTLFTGNFFSTIRS